MKDTWTKADEVNIALEIADTGDRTTNDPLGVLAEEVRRLRVENAKLLAYVSALEEQCDSIGLQKAQHAAGFNR